MKTAMFVGAVALTLVTFPAAAQMVGAGAASPIDKAFASDASASNTFEVRSSKLALMKSIDPKVRAMARWMIDSHTMAEQKLQSAASYAGNEGDADPVLTPETQATMDDLSKLDGAAFDQAYIADQVTAHKMTAQKLSDYRVAGTYDPLLAWDAATAPAVNDHLMHFEALAR